ncbi:C80 family cysteine peptidase [Roseateles sp. UC29_93]|uniref:C80 family cysteine peptidase n=1 Tax=Roseateles sp. UC29_93 TaxID=3350177 RepID=UPI00366D4A7A
MRRHLGRKTEALIRAAGTEPHRLEARANQGLLDLLSQDLERVLPTFASGGGLESTAVDRSVAALWNVLTLDSEVKPEASPEIATRSAMADMTSRSKSDPSIVVQMEAQLRQAGETLVEALRDVDPRKLYDAYRKVESAFKMTRGKFRDRVMLRSDAPGWFAAEPELELRGRAALQVGRAVRRDKAAWLVAMSDALEVVATAPGIDGARLASARVMEQVFRAAVLREPFMIDAGAVTAMAASTADADRSRLDALRSVYPMLQRLAKRGLSKTPRFVSDFNRPEWRELPDSRLMFTDADLLDALSAPLPPPLPMRPDAPVDPKAPLRAFWADQGTVSQRLDRAKGRIVVERGATGGIGAFKSIVRFDPLPDKASAEARANQNRQIRLLDDFVRAHFTPDIVDPSVVFPPEMQLDGDRILAGKLVVATRTGGRWSADAAAINQALTVLASHDVVGSFADMQSRVAPRRASQDPAVPRLRLILQLEPDGPREVDMQGTAAALMAKHPGESVHVQLNRSHGVRVVSGEELLGRLAKDGTVKLEIVGHAGRQGRGAQAALSGYSPKALAQRVRKALWELRLPAGLVDQITLDTCVLATPVLPHDYGSELPPCGARRAPAQPRRHDADRLCPRAPGGDGRIARIAVLHGRAVRDARP